MTDRATIVRHVQAGLLRLGYSGVGEIDGKGGFKTQAAILDFRNRNGMPLTVVMDDELLDRLETAPKIELPPEQIVATAHEIAPKVRAVKQTVAMRFYAKFWTLPSFVFTVLLGIIDNFHEAVRALMPVKMFLSDWLGVIQPITLLVAAFGILTIISALFWWRSRNVEAHLVEGYRDGSLRNDLPGIMP